jgi:hypothetical protein
MYFFFYGKDFYEHAKEKEKMAFVPLSLNPVITARLAVFEQCLDCRGYGCFPC